jgi:hypothetical protein
MPGALSQIVTSKAKCLLAQGDMTQDAVAKDLGISRKTVNRLSQACKEDIERLTLELINESVPLIKANHINTLKAAKQVLESKTESGEPDIEKIEAAKTLLNLSDKKEYRALLMMGIVPSHAPSVVVNQLFMGNQSNMVLDAGVQEALAGFAGHLTSPNDDDSSDSEVIDITDETLEDE